MASVNLLGVCSDCRIQLTIKERPPGLDSKLIEALRALHTLHHADFLDIRTQDVLSWLNWLKRSFKPKHMSTMQWPLPSLTHLTIRLRDGDQDRTQMMVQTLIRMIKTRHHEESTKGGPRGPPATLHYV